MSRRANKKFFVAISSSECMPHRYVLLYMLRTIQIRTSHIIFLMNGKSNKDLVVAISSSHARL